MKYILTALAIGSSALATAHAGVWNSSTYTYDARVIPFTTFDQERLSTQRNLPCKWVTVPQNKTAGYDFLCKAGTWATISYMLDKSPLDVRGLGRARLVWRSWHPDAHPSGGEAYTVQPFLTHVVGSLVPVRFAEDVEYAFWQNKSREWRTKGIIVRYEYDQRADHALHKLEVIGRAPNLKMLSNQVMIPHAQVAPIHMQQTHSPQAWTMSAPMQREELVPDTMLQTSEVQKPQMLEQSPIAQVLPQYVMPLEQMPIVHASPYGVRPVTPGRGGPAFLQEKEPLIPQEMLEEAASQPQSLEEMATKSLQIKPEEPVYKPIQSQSTGVITPAYKPWPLAVDKSQSSGIQIPTLKKAPVELNLGQPLAIPAPPSSLMPYGQDTLKNTSVLKEAEDLVPSTYSDTTVPMKERLLKEYYEAETTTERYRDRAEGKINEPLREKLIKE